jgi:hypothetical protein
MMSKNKKKAAEITDISKEHTPSVTTNHSTISSSNELLK